MNDAEYNRVFSDATDAWLAYIGLDRRRNSIVTLYHFYIRKSYNIFERNEEI